MNKIQLEKEHFESIIDESIVDDGYDDFNIIQESITNCDLEKSISWHEFVCQRVKDKKYFKGDYVRKGISKIISDYILIEVFPKKVETIIYE